MVGGGSAGGSSFRNAQARRAQGPYAQGSGTEDSDARENGWSCSYAQQGRAQARNGQTLDRSEATQEKLLALALGHTEGASAA